LTDGNEWEQRIQVIKNLKKAGKVKEIVHKRPKTEQMVEKKHQN
jgi:hypothetical protein